MLQATLKQPNSAFGKFIQPIERPKLGHNIALTQMAARLSCPERQV